MTGAWGSSWFYWAVGVALALPVALVALTEVQTALARRGSHLVRPLGLLRNTILPVGALLLLLTKATELSVDATGVRVVATAFGFVVLVLLLSGLNATLFQGAPPESWRRRVPSIFLDVARFALIAVGLAIILSFVWGANVGGLFAALGVSSIVLGLALQNSVGQIISGLFVLFEQPFRLGDWLDTPTARGRVVEVNWRATHIETELGLLVMPNSVLAGASFTNLSRPPGAHALDIVSTFSGVDAPDTVCRVLRSVAARLPQRRIDSEPSAVALGAGQYRTVIPLLSPADDVAANAQFVRRLWYAARRAELHLDGVADDYATAARVEEALRVMAPTLQLSLTDRRELLPHIRVVRYGAEEMLQTAGQVPRQMTFLVAGRVRLTAPTADGALLTVRTLEAGDFLGQTALTREPVTAGAQAVDECAVVEIDREHIEALVARKPLLLQEIGRTIDERRATLRRILDAARS